MNVAITSVRENPLLDRRELEVEVEHEGEETPSREDVKNRVAAENDLNTDEIEVQSVYTGFGSTVSRATLKVYQEFEYSEDLEESPLDRADDSPSSDEDLKKDPVEEKKEEKVEVTQDYEEAVSGTITEAKEALQEMDNPDYDAALKAEKDNKDRKTLKEWLENQQ